MQIYDVVVVIYGVVSSGDNCFQGDNNMLEISCIKFMTFEEINFILLKLYSHLETNICISFVWRKLHLYIFQIYMKK